MYLLSFNLQNKDASLCRSFFSYWTCNSNPKNRQSNNQYDEALNQIELCITYFYNDHNIKKVKSLLVKNCINKDVDYFISIIFDHYLINHWSRYCLKPLPLFLSDLYFDILNNTNLLTYTSKYTLMKMIKKKSLENLGRLAGVSKFNLDFSIVSASVFDKMLDLYIENYRTINEYFYNYMNETMERVGTKSQELVFLK